MTGGRAVAGAVIGEHPMEIFDAVGGEELHRSFPETCCYYTFLVREFFGVDRPGAGGGRKSALCEAVVGRQLSTSTGARYSLKPLGGPEI